MFLYLLYHQVFYEHIRSCLSCLLLLLMWFFHHSCNLISKVKLSSILNDKLPLFSVVDKNGTKVNVISWWDLESVNTSMVIYNHSGTLDSQPPFIQSNCSVVKQFGDKLRETYKEKNWRNRFLDFKILWQ